jgi:hypothetical protein
MTWKMRKEFIFAKCEGILIDYTYLSIRVLCA